MFISYFGTPVTTSKYRPSNEKSIITISSSLTPSRVRIYSREGYAYTKTWGLRPYSATAISLCL